MVFIDDIMLLAHIFNLRVRPYAQRDYFECIPVSCNGLTKNVKYAISFPCPGEYSQLHNASVICGM